MDHQEYDSVKRYFKATEQDMSAFVEFQRKEHYNEMLNKKYERYNGIYHGALSSFRTNLQKNKYFFMEQLLKTIKSGSVHSDCTNLAISHSDDSILNDFDYMSKLIKIEPKVFYLVRNHPDFKFNVEFLTLALQTTCLDLELCDMPKDNRLAACHTLFNINKNYEQRFGGELKKKLNGMSINQYVERSALKKSLLKNLDKNDTVIKRTKI